MDGTRPEPERPLREAIASDEGEGQPSSALRCPYCKAALETGALAGACVACGTLHHIACFSEHGGCSTHGCGSTRARPGKVGDPLPPAHFRGLTCVACRLALAGDAMAARCEGCGTVLHTTCYERVGTCLLGAANGCTGTVEIMSHAQAAAMQTARLGTALLLTGALVALVFGVLVLVAVSEDDLGIAVFMAVLTTLGLVLGGAGLVVRARATHTATLGRTPRRPPQVRDGAKDAP